MGSEDYLIALTPTAVFSTDDVARPRGGALERDEVVVDWTLNQVASVLDAGATSFDGPQIAVLLCGDDVEAQRAARRIMAPSREWSAWPDASASRSKD